MASPTLSSIEFIAQEGGSPVPVDLFSEQSHHLGIFAMSGSGRQPLTLDIITHTLAAGIPVFALDHSTYESPLKNFTRALEGEYTQCCLEEGNLFELPDTRALDPSAVRSVQEIQSEYIDYLELTLLAMVLGDREHWALVTPCRSILSLALKRFFEDSNIQSRYEAAFVDGISSDAWAQMPTMHDFVPFCKPKALDLQDDASHTEVFQLIDERLTFWLHGRLKRVIASPSTRARTANFQVFGIREDVTDEESIVLQLAATSSIFRSTLTLKKSLVYIDQASRFCQSGELSEILGGILAGGAKFGIHCVFYESAIDRIAACKSARKILHNLGTVLIGRISRPQAERISEVFGLPLQILKNNASHHFLPNRDEGYSNWLISRAGDTIPARHYPGELQLALSQHIPPEEVFEQLATA